MATQYAVEEKPSSTIRTQSLFAPVGTTELPKLPSKPTDQCFSGPQYGLRSINLNRWLLSHQPETLGCVVTALTPTRVVTEAEWVAALLGVPVDTPMKLTTELLKERNHTMSLVQVEGMVERTQQGLRTGMPTDGWSSFFFVENKKDGVELTGIYRDESKMRWCLRFSLNRDILWHCNHRLLVPNLDASKL